MSTTTLQRMSKEDFKAKMAANKKETAISKATRKAAVKRGALFYSADQDTIAQVDKIRGSGDQVCLEYWIYIDTPNRRLQDDHIDNFISHFAPMDLDSSRKPFQGEKQYAVMPVGNPDDWHDNYIEGQTIMEEVIYEERFSPDGKHVLRITVDASGDGSGNPRDNDNLSIMHCKNDMWSDPNEWGDMEDVDILAQIEKIAIAKLPIYVHKHGGVVMKTTPFEGVDSGLAGVAYTTHEVAKDLGCEDWSVERLEKSINTEIEEYNLYLQGEVYNYYLFEKTICDQGLAHLNEIDSGGGCLGDDGITGILDQFAAEKWLNRAPVNVMKKGVEHSDSMSR